ncbi:MAG TPA: exodeoxyribonuclease V subunit alpha [Nocardioides sp.]|uniref:exodeoxyribonuclease V subunit alpha n=1 Tax=Nocardioides sp. TaxID=35761 RepID=UPI002E34C99A|nr:exodeoxyribonuclease V subunit alpha [Nocardioides sp.]HEX3929823.1 exodeoxyribonuclease V subunit alpha [Nocardioides sp.]
MIEAFETDDVHDRRFAIGLDGVLGAFNAAGVLEAADAHAARRIQALSGEPDDEVGLAVALAVRSLRHGSVCLDLRALTAEPLPHGLSWPDEQWGDRVAASRVARAGVVRIEEGVVYLDRYWREECQVRDDLVARLGLPPPEIDETRLTALAPVLFPEGYDEQRAAALAAARQWTTVLTGGPGTGKTTAVAGLLALLADQSDRPLRIALSAPTGKAAARLQEAVRTALGTPAFADHVAAVGQPTAQTLHRLLGWRRGSRNRFGHDRRNRLPHDVIVVDETSMVSLTMMARLVEAVRADCRLVFVGDPDQLASVEAGAVLADLVEGLSQRAPATVSTLRTSHRFGQEINRLAEAVRDGDAERVLDLLTSGGEHAELLDAADPDVLSALRQRLVGHALQLRTAAGAGDAGEAIAILDRHRLLCAHRDGPWGVGHWNRLVERALAEHTGLPIGGGWGQEWYAGRPLLLTSNDYGLDLFNGDTGVVVAADAGVRAAIAVPRGHRELATSRLAGVETMHALTVHKSQGSQAEEVTVLLPPDDSPLLTRELLYTALTRAERKVSVVATPDAVRLAVRRSALRASGLAARLARLDPCCC